MSGIFLFGIDVSHYQGDIDWATVKAGPTNFVFMKASEGATFKSPAFARNWSGAEGLHRGAYHFFRPSVPGAAQAANFLSVWKPQKGDLLPVLDLEDFDGSSLPGYLSDIGEWMAAVSRAIGGKLPIVYTAAAFWQKIGNPTAYASHPLWVANYTQAAGPRLPAGWSDYTIWQYSDTGQVEGISGNCDVNLFNGGPDDIASIML